MASRSAKLLLFLPFVSPPHSVSLSPSVLEGHEALAEHDSVRQTSQEVDVQGVYGVDLLISVERSIHPIWLFHGIQTQRTAVRLLRAVAQSLS